MIHMHDRIARFLVVVVFLSLSVSTHAHAVGNEQENISFDIVEKPLIKVIEVLWEEYLVPISFIDTNPQSIITIKVKSGSIYSILDRVVSLLPRYEYHTINQRLVLLPREVKYGLMVADLDVLSEQRIDAGYKLVEAVRTQYKEEFGRLGQPPMVGNLLSNTYTDVVSLSSSGKVMDLFVQLLGKRRETVFVIAYPKPDFPVLWLHSVNQAGG